MTPETLPIKPDPHTGLPRPPHAPRGYKGSSPTLRPLRTMRNPLPREEEWGPPLEWNINSIKGAVAMGAIAFAMIFGFMAVKLKFDFSPQNVAFWIFGLILALLAAWLLYGIGRAQWVLAGARWLQNGKAWVSLYDLAEVKVGAGGGGQTFTLTDSSGRTVSYLKLWPIQNNQLFVGFNFQRDGVQHS
jgi:hypothetical protein